MIWLVTTAPYSAPTRSADGGAQFGTLGPAIGVHLPEDALHAWMAGALDEGELAEWFRALLTLDWRKHQYIAGLPKLLVNGPVDPVLAALGPFRDGMTPATDEHGARYALTTELVTHLASGHPERAHRAAQQRLRQLGYAVVTDPVHASQSIDHGKRLAAALLPRTSARGAFDCVAYRLLTNGSEDMLTKERP